MILRVTRALDDVALVIAGDDHLPGAHPVRLLARQDDLAGLVLHPLEQDLDVVARLGRRLVLPLVERDQALGLVADIHDDLVAHDLDDLARDDPADLEALALAQELVEGVGAVLAHHQGRELVVTDIKFTEQITIYHVGVRFKTGPRDPGRRTTASAAEEGTTPTRYDPSIERRTDPRPKRLQRIRVGQKRSHPSTQGAD